LTGQPSIDPELLLRILLIGYLYGVTSERRLVEELGMHWAWRWFTGLGFDQEIPHHFRFSKNRHGRFQESKLFEQLFEEIVRQCDGAGRGGAPVGGWQIRWKQMQRKSRPERSSFGLSSGRVAPKEGQAGDGDDAGLALDQRSN
jgi:hypothetical protein